MARVRSTSRRGPTVPQRGSPPVLSEFLRRRGDWWYPWSWSASACWAGTRRDNLDHAEDGLVAHLAYAGVSESYRVGGPGANEPE
jgi:hypothetical protein